jgi:imidazolonepropionase-like amidohydrolase
LAACSSDSPPLAALETATLNQANLMKLTDEYGTVTPGRVADLLLLDHHPIRDITAGAKCAAVN